MRWSWRNIMIGTSAAAAAIGLAVALVVVLAGRGVPPAAPKPSPGRSSQLYSPFTGEPVTALGPVLAVKIDNLAPARPQTGLAGADIVYVLPVEGGLSRFLAVYSSHVPPVIGPVRSAREDDLELLRQFGRPAFAYSGAQPQLLPVVERARTVDLYAGRVPVSPGPAATSAIRAGSRRTTCTRARRGCSPRRPARAGRTTSGSGSARHRRAGALRRRSRCPTRRPRSRSAGRPGTDGGWSGWTVHPRARPRAAR